MSVQQPPGGMPVLETVRAGVDHLRGSMQVMAVPTALTALVQAVILTLGAGAAAVQPLFLPLLTLVAALIAAPLQAAHYRRLLGLDEGRLRFGRSEALLIGATLTYGFFLFIVIVIGVFLLSAFLALWIGGAGVDLSGAETPEAVLRQLGAQGSGMVLATVIPGLLALLYVQSRLVTFGPATVAEGRILVFSTWGWTKGNGWWVLLATVLLVAPLYLVLLLPAAVRGALTIGSTPPAQASPPGLFVFEFGRSFLTLWLLGAAVWGQQAYFYRGLKPA